MTVLVITSSTAGDSGVDSVISALQARGAGVFRFDADGFPTESSLRLAWDDKDGLGLSSPAGDLDLDTVSAVWIRHFDAAARLPDDLAPDHRDAARDQSERAIWALLQCLPAFQLDPPESLARAPYQPRQLQLARSFGLAIPRTLVTNDPRAARSFVGTCNAGVIAKLITSGSIHVESEQGRSVIYASALSPEDIDELDALDSLVLSPMIFQERIPKALELRITIVGVRLFVAAVDSTQSALGADDWRRDKRLAGSFHPYRELPGEIETRLLQLADRLGLNFATVDMIRTPDGRHVFLELNTTSYFDFVEKSAGLPISDAIADLLLGLAPRR